MPRKKKEVTKELADWVDTQARDIAKDVPLPAPMTEDDATLVARYLSIRDWLDAESKRFVVHCAPLKAQMEAIENEFLKRLNDRGQDASPTEHGTAYKSVLLNVSLSPEGRPYGQLNGREAFLDYCLDNWEGYGNEALLFSAQKDAVKRYMEEHEGNPPPGVKTAFHTRINVRRS